MNSFKTSYIFTKQEIQFLFRSISGVTPSCPARYILSQYLSDSFSSQEAIEGLVYKKLARKSPGKIVLEPVVDLLARSALSSDTLWIVEFSEVSKPLLLLRSKDIDLRIQHYPYIPSTWKITPYQSKDAFLTEFDELTVTCIIQISKDGTQQLIAVDDIKSRIEDGEG